MIASFFILLNSGKPKRFSVSEDNGIWIVRKSLLLSTSSKDENSTPICLAFSSVGWVVKAITFNPKQFDILATRLPIEPKPIIPMVFPASSTPLNSFQLKWPVLTCLSANEIFLTKLNNKENTCSATASVA